MTRAQYGRVAPEAVSSDRVDAKIKALGRLGRTRSGRNIIKAHGPALISLIFDPWAEFDEYPPLLIRMHLKPEDLR